MKAWLSRYGLLLVFAIVLIANNYVLFRLYVTTQRAERELQQLQQKAAHYLS